MNNLQKYKKGLETLIDTGNHLYKAMLFECHPEQVKEQLGEKSKTIIKDLPSFRDKYQNWYSKSLVVIKLLLPHRINDFVKLYEKRKNKKSGLNQI